MHAFESELKRQMDKNNKLMKGVDLTKVKDLSNIGYDCNGKLIKLNPVNGDRLPNLNADWLNTITESEKNKKASAMATIENEDDDRLTKLIETMIKRGKLTKAVTDVTGESNNQFTNENVSRGVKYSTSKGNSIREV